MQQDQGGGGGGEGDRQTVGEHAGIVEFDGDRPSAQAGEQVEKRWEARVFDDHGVTEADVGAQQAVDGVERAVEDGEAFGAGGPVGADGRLEFGEDGLTEIGGGQVVEVPVRGEGAQGGRQIREQRRIGGAACEVDAKSAVGVRM